MEVDIEVNESDIVRVAMGNKSEIEVDAYLSETFLGQVTEIGNTALNAGSNGFNLDQVTNFSVKVRIQPESYEHLLANSTSSQTPFRPGMSATVDLLTQKVDSVISVPIQCVTTRKSNEDDEAELGVFLFDNETVTWTVVETGIQDNRYIEIISGIDRRAILVSGPYDMVSRKLEDGDKVKGEEDAQDESDEKATDEDD
jgi:HlyD family secretion protein